MQCRGAADPRTARPLSGPAGLRAQVSAHVTAAQVKFLLLHDGKGEDAVRAFFRDVHELYLRVMMSPFFSPASHIRRLAF